MKLPVQLYAVRDSTANEKNLKFYTCYTYIISFETGCHVVRTHITQQKLINFYQLNYCDHK